ncbi:hypothetical protein TTHERM_000474449 (macronuclear) [Tetrahymena thermophila SB210]|uniref:Uncharacterized protein n=1 Tax=Tetrahymena thermophila (strain SB210) TaxID=312017 RepID=W7WYR8_TETTS|nr:hypothetical protein TTHERM_000474449 [Tetrahymena thermophila SB210]EWS72045.1 hypothetical protein TTHERM_000474449 [Tetrahymena thermophila SB210]|eukprot:XP_012655420.1 hypothetical protein TTHERM_000474449 [Tetrahymena thermophila SB210]
MTQKIYQIIKKQKIKEKTKLQEYKNGSQQDSQHEKEVWQKDQAKQTSPQLVQIQVRHQHQIQLQEKKLEKNKTKNLLINLYSNHNYGQLKQEYWDKTLNIIQLSCLLCIENYKLFYTIITIQIIKNNSILFPLTTSSIYLFNYLSR